MGFKRLQLTLIVLLTHCLPAQAAPDSDALWALCGATPDWARAPLSPNPELASERQAIHLFADTASVSETGESLLQGEVTLQRGTQWLSADNIKLDNQLGDVEVTGHIKATDEGFAVRGEAGKFNLNTREGLFSGVEYQIPPLHARGQADTMELKGLGLAYLTNAYYTTCNEGKRDWILSARTIRIDQEEEEGSARNVVLRFKNVPFFYTPYISFPISDKRKSGLLAPRIGTNEGGWDIETPYYLNLAPNRDLTLTPRFLQYRGVQLKSDLRYLNRRSRGELRLSNIEDDIYGSDRWSAGYQHSGALSRHLNINIAAAAVSDETYFQDLGTSLELSSITHLERRADLRYSRRYWDLLLRAQGYQSVSETLADQSKPYQRLPQLKLTGDLPEGPLRLRYQLNAEWVRFDRANSTVGDRLDIMPALSAPLIGASYFLIPKIKGRYTQYTLEDSAQNPIELERSLPISSLDSGLIFERQAGADLRQTLEPRLFYLHTPYREQGQIPVFDTGKLDFNFNQLFRDDRFSGADRVGDAQRLSMALTSRLISKQRGDELFRASLGQILYFRDRRVVLPGDTVQSEQRSDLAAELSTQPTPQWTLRTSMLWDSERRNTDRASSQLQYRRDHRRVVNLAHRYRRSDFEQMDISFAWPVTDHWKSVGRWTYSLNDNQDIETFAGVEYESCCWAVRVVGRRYITGADQEYNQSLYFQLVLKGLTSLGENLDEFLQRGILGYETDY